MARYRTIKPELCADEKLTACSVDARFLFLCLLCFVDDMGRKQYAPRRIKAEVFPADSDFTPEVVEALVQELAAVGVVELYDIGKARYLRIPHFLDHQVINKPGHSNVPASPSEDPNKPRCKCKRCQIEGPTNGRVFLQEQFPSHSRPTTVVPERDRNTPVAGTAGVGVGVGVGVGSGMGDRARGDVHSSAQEREPAEGGRPQSETETSGKERNSPLTAASEIAGKLLDLLGVVPNMHIMQVLTQTILLRSEVEKCSIELAANELSGRAAVLARDSPPESWEDWLHDARYDVVPQGDKRINQRGQMARPSCGGSLCSQGWEPVLVDGVRRLRRCPDCVRAWKDAGLG